MSISSNFTATLTRDMHVPSPDKNVMFPYNTMIHVQVHVAVVFITVSSSSSFPWEKLSNLLRCLDEKITIDRKNLLLIRESIESG